MRIRVYAYACPRVFHGLSFPKIVYLVQKIVLFSTNTFLKSFLSDQALNQPQVLEFLHHWGMGAQVMRGKKRGVYTG